MPALPITSPWLYRANSAESSSGVADLADVADDVRGEAVARVKPALDLDQLHFGEVRIVAVGLDKGQFAPGQLLLDDDGLVARPRANRFRRAVTSSKSRSSLGDFPHLLGLQGLARRIRLKEEWLSTITRPSRSRIFPRGAEMATP